MEVLERSLFEITQMDVGNGQNRSYLLIATGERFNVCFYPELIYSNDASSDKRTGYYKDYNFVQPFFILFYENIHANQ